MSVKRTRAFSPHTTRLVVSFQQRARELVLWVQGDGAPIITANIPGMGLRGMDMRVKELRGNIEAIAKPDGGFEVCLTLPIRR